MNHLLPMEKINILEQKISSLNNEIIKNEGKTPIGKKIFDTFMFIIFMGACLSLAVTLMGTFFIGKSLLGSIDYYKASLTMISLGLLSLFSLIPILTMSEIYSNQELLYRKENKNKFFSKLIQFGKNILFTRIYKKNYSLLEKKEQLTQEFHHLFNKNSMNIIFDFYKNNPYEFGTQAQKELLNNFNKIINFYEKEDYLSIFSLYYQDYQKYNYEKLNIYY